MSETPFPALTLVFTAVGFGFFVDLLGFAVGLAEEGEVFFDMTLRGYASENAPA